MLITIELRGLTLGSGLRARIEKRLAGTLAKVWGSPVTARVTFADENRAKGGRGMRCALTVKLPRRSVIRAEDVAETAWLAFDRCFDRLKRHLAADRERRLKLARFPKKQFAAKKLLMEEAGPETRA